MVKACPRKMTIGASRRGADKGRPNPVVNNLAEAGGMGHHSKWQQKAKHKKLLE
ncbi:hypothetical protein ABIE49_005787 [Bradyrhizobium sp. OAE829]